MSIYTRTGDFGETSLFGGKRKLKSDILIDLCGDIDELNSFMGLVISFTHDGEVQEFLREIQKDLLTTTAFLAGSKIDLSFFPKRVGDMESSIDRLGDAIPSLQQFILPGGSPLASHIHVTRSITRRVERKVVQVSKHISEYSHIDEKQMSYILQYLNRLSDFLYVLARFVNMKENVEEIVWGGNEKEKNNL